MSCILGFQFLESISKVSAACPHSEDLIWGLAGMRRSPESNLSAGTEGRGLGFHRRWDRKWPMKI